MKKITALLLTLLLVLAAVPAGAEDVRYIQPLQTYDSRLKLRSEPSQGAPVLGQYYAGTRVTVHSESGGWARVSAGGREGYMMSSFLTREPVPETRGRVLNIDGRHVWDESGTDIGTAEPGMITVLGTVDENTLHVLLPGENGQERYGYMASAWVSWPDNLSRAVVWCKNADDAVNVREKPDTKSVVQYRLFPGTEVYCLFDDHTAGDGWTRVRCGDSCVGYIRNDYLDFSSAGCMDFVPAPVRLNKDQATVTAALRTGTVSRQSYPLFVLGKAGSTASPMYYCLSYSWDENGEYTPFTCCIQKKDLEEVRGSVPTSGKLSRECPLYEKDGAGAFRALEGRVFPQGQKLKVIGSLQEPFWRYVSEDVGWISAEIWITDTESTSGWIPADAAEYDPRLLLPGDFTNG